MPVRKRKKIQALLLTLDGHKRKPPARELVLCSRLSVPLVAMRFAFSPWGRFDGRGSGGWGRPSPRNQHENTPLVAGCFAQWDSHCLRELCLLEVSLFWMNRHNFSCHS